MDSALTADRWQFAFTITFHYLFPQLTMGLTLLILLMKARSLRPGGGIHASAARFWGKILAITFAMGVVTGIPLEFQFGTNWARFSAAAGGIIGQPLAMEGVFSFFLESTFLGLFLFGEKRLGPRLHALSAFMVFAGAWLSGFFFIATNAWMQHPVGYSRGESGEFVLASFWKLFSNPWLFWQYMHAMLGSVVTASVVMASIGAFYLLVGRHELQGRLFVRTGVLVGAAAAIAVAFPTGDQQAKLVSRHQPATFAAMEGVFHTERGVSLVLVGQPDMEKLRLDNPIEIPRALSFLTHNRWTAEVIGLTDFPREDWPDNVPLLYYAYHVMAGLGTVFIAVLSFSAALLWKGRLFRRRGVLWALMLLLPFPYIANTAGWLTAELGRQPWIIHGLMRTRDGMSPNVSAGNVLFTLIGFMGLYAVLGILFLFLVTREIERGPES